MDCFTSFDDHWLEKSKLLQHFNKQGKHHQNCYHLKTIEFHDELECSFRLRSSAAGDTAS
ncbi:hypothetical protein chiPu_0025507, partial [Chiloscyllium punctatum]|nr:hypothetical protein [Chiloscyllium punctatum]